MPKPLQRLVVRSTAVWIFSMRKVSLVSAVNNSLLTVQHPYMTSAIATWVMRWRVTGVKCLEYFTTSKIRELPRMLTVAIATVIPTSIMLGNEVLFKSLILHLFKVFTMLVNETLSESLILPLFQVLTMLVNETLSESLILPLFQVLTMLVNETLSESLILPLFQVLTMLVNETLSESLILPLFQVLTILVNEIYLNHSFCHCFRFSF